MPKEKILLVVVKINQVVTGKILSKIFGEQWYFYQESDDWSNLMSFGQWGDISEFPTTFMAIANPALWWEE